jgi:nucleoside-diphosphate-sugar epimerase
MVTGALGCIGAWVVRQLAADGDRVVGFDLGGSTHRLDLLVPDRERVTLVAGDVTDPAAVAATLDDHRVTRVIHLAALQIPGCRADPALGMRVNVLGTTTVLEAVRARRDRIPGVVYASSFAVYGPDDVPGRDEPHPRTVYGVTKVANEALARVYWEEYGVPSAALRPYVVYGAGRDQGLTSSPTLAIAAALRGERFTIGFGGRSQFHYARDVAAAFVALAREPAEGASVFDLPGPVLTMPEVIASIAAAVPGAALDYDEAVQLPFPEAATRMLEAPVTPFDDAVRETVELLR